MLLWMLYAIGVAGVMAVACICLEAFVLSLRRAVRFVWIIGVLLAAATAVVSMTRDRRLTEHDPGTDMILSGSEAPGVQAATTGPAPGITLESLDRPLSWMWLFGSIASACALVVIALRTRRAIGRAARRTIDGTSVLVTEKMGPALIGVVRYDIVVPAWLSAMSREQQKLIIEHERQHARAFDPALVWMSAASIVAFPWNPAFWFMLRRLRTAIELDCDRRVLNCYPHHAEYAALLVDVGERASSLPALAAALNESAGQLQRRITAIVSVGRRIRPAAAVGSVVVLAVLLTAAIRVPEPSFPSVLREHSASPADTSWSEAELSPREAAEEAARRLEPRAFDRKASPGSSVIGLLFDSAGEVAHHSRLSVPDDNANARQLMPRLFPNVRQADNAPYTIMARIEGEQGTRHVDVVAVFLRKPPSQQLLPVYYEYQVQKPAAQLPGMGAPIYPPTLRTARVEGEVIASFVVNERGLVRPRTFKVIKATNDLFVAAVTAALGKMSFTPAEVEGRRVQQMVQQSFMFRLQ